MIKSVIVRLVCVYPAIPADNCKNYTVKPSSRNCLNARGNISHEIDEQTERPDKRLCMYLVIYIFTPGTCRRRHRGSSQIYTRFFNFHYCFRTRSLTRFRIHLLIKYWYINRIDRCSVCSNVHNECIFKYTGVF